MDTKLENLVKDYLMSTYELYQYGINICNMLKCIIFININF
jgi:hypothetical protein